MTSLSSSSPGDYEKILVLPGPVIGKQVTATTVNEIVAAACVDDICQPLAEKNIIRCRPIDGGGHQAAGHLAVASIRVDG